MTDLWCLAAVILALSPGGVTEQSYSRIHLFMTRAQVEYILGGPSLGKGPEVDPDYFCPYYTVTSYETHRLGELWRSGRTRIWIRFNDADRVTGKVAAVGNDPLILRKEVAEKFAVHPERLAIMFVEDTK